MTSDAGVGLELTVGTSPDVEHMIRAEGCGVIDARAAEASPTGTEEDTDATTDLALQQAVDTHSQGAAT